MALLPRSKSEHTGIDVAVDKVVAELARRGLLLKQDKRLPSAITLLAGAPLATSWWSHPQGRLFFRVLQALTHHPDVRSRSCCGARTRLYIARCGLSS